jgi:hypothetical protein
MTPLRGMWVRVFDDIMRESPRYTFFITDITPMAPVGDLELWLVQERNTLRPTYLSNGVIEKLKWCTGFALYGNKVPDNPSSTKRPFPSKT